MAVVGRVDCILGGVCGNRQSRDRKLKHASSTIESENMYPVAQCENEGGLRSVDYEPCAHLLVTRAQKMIRGSQRIVESGENREDRPDGYIGIDVRRAVQRIDRQSTRLNSSHPT